MDIIDSLKDKKNELLNISRTFIEKEKDKVLKRKKIKDLYIPYISGTFAFLSIISGKIINAYPNLQVSKFFDVLKVLDSYSFFILLFFVIFMYIKFGILNTINTNYFEEKKIRDLILSNNYSEFLRYKEKLGFMKKSKLSKIYLSETEKFMLNDQNLRDIIEIIKKSDITKYSKERMYQKYISEKGINFNSAINLIDNAIEEQEIMEKIKAKNKIMDYVKSI